jgi:hypothetical protein
MINEREKIERYLDGKMSPTENDSFEEEMENNPLLSDAVTQNKDLLSFFNNKNVDLEQTLSNLGTEYFTNEKATDPTPYTAADAPFKNRIRFVISLLSLLIVIIGIFWYFNTADKKPTDINTPSMSTTEMEKIINDNMLDEQGGDVINNSEDNTPIEIEPEVIDSKTNPTDFDINETENPPKKEGQPIANLNEASFQENTVLESLIRENVRSDSQTRINAPIQGETFQRKNGMVILGFNGTTEAASQFELIIYDNSPKNFNNDYQVLNAMLKKTSNNDSFQLSFNVKVELKPGLYYYLIRTKEAAEMVYLSKFYIR